MDPTKENIILDQLQEQFNNTMLGDIGAVTETISTGIVDDDIITLSSYPWGNTGSTITNTSLTGAYSYPTTVSVSGGPYNNSTVISNPWATYNNTTPTLQLNGEGADIKVNDWSLVDAIKKLEERLNILTPNTKLEEEWEELRALGNKYKELEQQIKDKQATWDRLKAMPPPEIK